jgi:hypothetical protein
VCWRLAPRHGLPVLFVFQNFFLMKYVQRTFSKKKNQVLRNIVLDIQETAKRESF